MEPTNRIYPSGEVARAAKSRAAVVALESTVVTHGLPYPQNLQVARDMEAAVRRAGAIPATVVVIEGQSKVGLSNEELAQLAQGRNNLKISRRDFAVAVLKKAN